MSASGTTGDIAPQASSNAISLSYSTASSGQIGTVTLDLKSDGTGIDGLGMLDLGTVTIPVVVDPKLTIAAAALQSSNGIALTGTIDSGDAGLTILIVDGVTQIGAAIASSSGAWSTNVTVSSQGVHLPHRPGYQFGGHRRFE